MVRKKSQQPKKNNPSPQKQQQKQKCSNSKQKTPKKRASASAVENLPENFEEDIRWAHHRFMFNVEQIEQRYCKSASGMVINLTKERFEFDEELCTERDDEEKLIKMIKRQQHVLNSPNGGTLLSTLALDPDQKNEQQIKRWKTLNKLFDKHCEKLKEKQENNDGNLSAEMPGTSNSAALADRGRKVNSAKVEDQQCTALVKHTNKPMATIRQQQDSPNDIDWNNVEVNIDAIDFGMIERFYRLGGALPAGDLCKLVASNRHIPFRMPSTIKRKLEAIKNQEEEEGELDDLVFIGLNRV